MRLWSLHPKYLDPRGLVALWREALLAQAVLRGQTRGYTHHPQLERFRDLPSPAASIAEYLRTVQHEAENRGYRFDRKRIVEPFDTTPISVTRGQLAFEWSHLMHKLDARDLAWKERVTGVTEPQPHPLFRIVEGDVARWEKGVDRT